MFLFKGLQLEALLDRPTLSKLGAVGIIKIDYFLV